MEGGSDLRKAFFAFFTLGLFFSFELVSAYSTISKDPPFPIRPEPITPGSLCESPTEYRYPEQIPYCRRNVSTARKWNIIHTYDRVYSYQIAKMNRQDFKVDHKIPLCMGGSNEDSNLWPQHKSVYIHTDALEHSLCLKMARGELSQSKAVEIMRNAKANPFDFDFSQYYEFY